MGHQQRVRTLYFLSSGGAQIGASPQNDTFTHISSQRTIERRLVPVKPKWTNLSLKHNNLGAFPEGVG